MIGEGAERTEIGRSEEQMKKRQRGCNVKFYSIIKINYVSKGSLKLFK